MTNPRFEALKQSQSRVKRSIPKIKQQSKLFGKHVFGNQFMKQYLPKSAFTKVAMAIKKGDNIDRTTADAVATGMKLWALKRGATHYTHWFQPLTGATAEKHDSFFHLSTDGSVIEKFDGEQLVQQAPDASSFPSGGLRNTFEARGYTAWDPTSPAFIYEGTLCIPTIFVAYTGEALDNKTPLLKSLHALDEAATQVAGYFNKTVSKVNATLGWEQEFFLVDTALANCRPDIMLTGRTLVGHSSAKGQQLDDHYFGSIPSRVLDYLKHMEYECLLLGIPIKTRHNEVAPNQFEIAPVFEEVNLAVDHNALVMDVMQRVAQKHYFKVLLHEKPFAGINGSGKHNNWSLQTDTGINLLSPGSTPMKNLRFLTFFVNTIKAVKEHEALLRAAVASAGNNLRLGANEAPPAIMSVFIGKQLTMVLNELEKVTDGKLSPQEKTELKLNVVGKIPEILLDNTDRNRTSPFAFTGNKFEFRAVGASANCATPMIVLNAIVAEQLTKFKIEVDALIEKEQLKKDDAIFNVLREYIKESKSIRYEGDGYAEQWPKEAKKRKLSHLKTVPEALAIFKRKEVQTLFEGLSIMNTDEQQARYEIGLENYVKQIQIESRVLGDLVVQHIIPAAVTYQNELMDYVTRANQLNSSKDSTAFAKAEVTILKMLQSQTNILLELVHQMIDARKKANDKELEKKASLYTTEVMLYLEQIKKASDKIEQHLGDRYWVLPKSRELLFVN